MSFTESQSERRRRSPSTEVSDRLRGDLHDDNEAAKAISELAHSAIPVLTETVDAQGSWPYELRGGTPTPQKKSSPSTNAMVAFALAVLVGDLADEPLAPGRRGEHAPGLDPKRPWVDECQKSVWMATARQFADASPAEQFSSPTFGDDDPFTVYWAYRLVDALATRGELDAQLGRLREKAKGRVKGLAEPREAILRFPDSAGHQDDDRAPPHVWPLVRAVHLAKAIGIEPDAEARDYFIERVLVQLSYSEITDSLFDVGELVFAFEGALACDEGACSRALVERVARVVIAAQAWNPSLRALSPFRVTGAGGVNTPVSIEVAAALLRSCWILDRSGSSVELFSKVSGVFDRYVDWLRSTVQMVDARNATGEPTRFAGWRSEHAFTAEPSIHTWYTSQVILFLASYRAMIDQHVADSSLRSARFSVRLPARTDDRWGEREPLASAAATSAYRVYDRLRESFIEPRRGSSALEPHCSFLLYGPPGTGKTSLVEALAAELGWEMITITPSDFVVGGESQVEARAKDIFDVLGYQSEKVILFDEIDRLLLDRDSPEYAEQSDIFQFMTPSMLPKLQRLNDQGRNIVCIATNYAWRIDRAITRPGRIDNRFLLLPPDRTRREEIVMTLRSKNGQPPDEVAKKVAIATPLHAYGELKAGIDMARGDAAEDQIVAKCGEITPAASLEPSVAQLKRLEKNGQRRPPTLVEEHLLLRFLQLEVVSTERHASLSDADLKLVGGRAALDVVRDPAIKYRLTPPSP